jgi:L-lactate dehydrogenase complex protein LldE
MVNTAGHPVRRVGLFITCLSDQFYPRVGVAVVKILEHLGCSVEFPSEQTCCGQPFYNNGYQADARALAQRFVGVFESFDYVVTPSASCCAMVREHFPGLLADDAPLAQRVEALAGRTYEFVEFLDKVLQMNVGSLALPRPTTVSVHHNCHQRAIGAGDRAVQLLRRIGNVQLRPLEGADQCCGFGGTFAVKYPQISAAMVQEKARCIAAAGTQVTISSDAGCTMNIAGMCHRQGIPTQVRHIAELMAEALELELDTW